MSEKEREVSRERGRKYRENMSEEQRTRKSDRDKQNRRAAKKERLTLNKTLFKKGKRICSRCYDKKVLSAYSTKGNSPSNYNKICDSCLIKLYQTISYSPEVLTPKFWRKKAYSCNGGFISRQKRRGIDTAIQTLGTQKITGEELLKLFECQNRLCLYCHTDLSDGQFQLDHRTPINGGGKHGIENIDIVCADCNMLKFDKDPEYFKGFIGSYAKRILQVIELQDKEPVR